MLILYGWSDQFITRGERLFTGLSVKEVSSQEESEFQEHGQTRYCPAVDPMETYRTERTENNPEQVETVTITQRSILVYIATRAKQWVGFRPDYHQCGHIV